MHGTACLNPSFANDGVCFVNDRQLRFALREWRNQFSKPPTLVILLAVGVLLAILGPFNTDQNLPNLQRFIYWLAMSVGTYSIGLIVNLMLWPSMAAALPKPAALVAVGLAVGFAITPVITLLNLISFNFWPSLSDWPVLLAQFLTIALIITVIFQTLSGHLSGSDETPRRAPDILSRLPLDKRGALVSLSSEDHYTRIRTSKGEELILIRLADAIREAEPTKGMQVHRSHWVALDQVSAARKDGDRAVLTLRTGGDIPVSRTHMPAIRDAGLLPR